MKRQHVIVTAMAIVLTLVLAACGDDDATTVIESGDPPDEATGTDAGDDEAAFPVTVEADNGAVTIEARPAAIVSLSPTATEMLFAIDAGDQVVAVDEYSYYPEDAPVTDLSGFEPNLEAIADHEPDLVVFATEPGDLADGLAELGIPAIQLDAVADMDGVYEQIEVLGAATGHAEGASELVGRMQADVEAIAAELPDGDAPLTYFHELDDMLYTVTTETFIGQVYALLGLESIADEADGVAESGGYPQLSEEFILGADPDFVFLADAECCGQTAETVAARPGWDTLTAVANGNVVVLDGDIASRWGPRIIDHLRAVADAVLAGSATG